MVINPYAKVNDIEETVTDKLRFIIISACYMLTNAYKIMVIN
jgi:hypothetical protein